MVVLVNGQRRELPAGSTVATAIESFHLAPTGRGVAVAVDGEVVPRGAWGATSLVEGARVELVVAVQGG